MSLKNEDVTPRTLRATGWMIKKSSIRIIEEEDDQRCRPTPVLCLLCKFRLALLPRARIKGHFAYAGWPHSNSAQKMIEVEHSFCAAFVLPAGSESIAELKKRLCAQALCHKVTSNYERNPSLAHYHLFFCRSDLRDGFYNTKLLIHIHIHTHMNGKEA